MSNIISAITDFLIVGFLGGGILLFAGEIKLGALKKSSVSKSKLSTYTERMTGSKLDLSNERVYGK